MVIAFLAFMAAAGFFRNEKIGRGKKYILEQSLEHLKVTFDKMCDRLEGEKKALTDRFDLVDPERLIDHPEEACGQGEYSQAEGAAPRFTDAQSEAFGKAADVLTEQRILNSEVHGKGAIYDAPRCVRVARAVALESKRLEQPENSPSSAQGILTQATRSKR